MPIADREARRKYNRAWMARRRKEWFDVNGPCVDCDSWDALELDHVDPNVKVTHRVWSWRLDRRQEELAKCVARCNECHKKRTLQQSIKNICVRGHDKEVLGRDTDGSCAECRRENQRRYRAA